MGDVLSFIKIANQGLKLIPAIYNTFLTLRQIKSNALNTDFIISNCKKHVTIYKNGHGIMICSYDIQVINPKNFEYFYRRINIDDGNVDAKFPSLNSMIKHKNEDRFSKYGFWYSCTDNIIQGVEEYYWTSRDLNHQDEALKNNKKELRWRFIINRNNIEKGGIYNITYSVSIPGMFPIMDYKFCKEKSINMSDRVMSSSLDIMHYAKRLEYIISFEKGDGTDRFYFDREPNCEIRYLNPNRNNNNNFKKMKLIPDNFYTKHLCVIKNPKFTSSITVSWIIN